MQDALRRPPRDPKFLAYIVQRNAQATRRNKGRKIKQLLRSMACRTREALWNAMQSVLDQVSATDAANCFTHCGYTLQLD